MHHQKHFTEFQFKNKFGLKIASVLIQAADVNIWKINNAIVSVSGSNFDLKLLQLLLLDFCLIWIKKEMIFVEGSFNDK